jgi:hypothetical protein
MAKVTFKDAEPSDPMYSEGPQSYSPHWARAVLGNQSRSTNTGARYEIMIDGVGRSNRDTREIAIEAANFLKERNPHSKVVVRDRETGEITEVTFTLPPSRGR